tara:strand:+ start:1187 stop:1462 length:276 start_codon:yes stop_codon:yes gene_type:complete
MDIFIKFLTRMGLITNGKRIIKERTAPKGAELKSDNKVVAEQLAKASKDIGKDHLTADEIDFCLVKLREATYSGHEFETFYKVFVKLTKLK